MAPQPQFLNKEQIRAILSDEDDDDLGLLSASDEEGPTDEEDDGPPDIVEVLNEHGELIILPMSDIDQFAVDAAPFEVAEPDEDEDGEQLELIPPPTENGEQLELIPPPTEDGEQPKPRVTGRFYLIF